MFHSRLLQLQAQARCSVAGDVEKPTLSHAEAAGNPVHAGGADAGVLAECPPCCGDSGAPTCRCHPAEVSGEAHRQGRQEMSVSDEAKARSDVVRTDGDTGQMQTARVKCDPRSRQRWVARAGQETGLRKGHHPKRYQLQCPCKDKPCGIFLSTAVS